MWLIGGVDLPAPPTREQLRTLRGGDGVLLKHGIAKNGDREFNAPCWLSRYAACFLSSTTAAHMASTAVRYPTLLTSTVPAQRTSVEVTDSLLCPPELELVARVSRPLYLFV